MLDQNYVSIVITEVSVVTNRINRGKDFEEVIKQSFLKVPNVSVDRLPDPTNGYLGIRNVCDFIVYKYPRQYYVECKSVHGNTFPLANLSRNQYDGMLEKSKIAGVVAGVFIWFVDHDVTVFVPIDQIKHAKEYDKKSIRYDDTFVRYIPIVGKKKRVFFDYDMTDFFEKVEDQYGRD